MSTAARSPSATSAWRQRLQQLLELRVVQMGVMVLIVVNAAILGLETVQSMAPWLSLLQGLDHALLVVFVIELLLRLLAYGLRFFRDPWSVFDFLVIGIALLPATGPLSVLRALRVLRAMRLIALVPSMKRVVSALLAAIPGMGSIILLLLLVQYVAAVMATKLFAGVAPEYFGDLGETWFTLFQIMTVEGWSEIARQVMVELPWAWVYFVAYLLLSTFTVLNLFVGVVVSAMQETLGADQQAANAAEQALENAHQAEVLSELRALRSEVAALRATRE